MKLALISDVFFGADSEQRLSERLEQAKAQGAELAVLPELALDPWFPARRDRRDSDAELPGGPRSQILATAAKTVGIGVVGGAVVRDPASSERRHNTALVFDREGRLVGSYAKSHLPEEEGYWETSHYAPGDQPAVLFEQFGMPFGIQICSDANRPVGSMALAARGAELILVPRATESRTFPRWRLVFQAIAMTSCAYVVSVNRPRPELDVAMGGPSVVVDPNGKVLLETTDPVVTTNLDRTALDAARKDYPGYLPVRADLYAQAWQETMTAPPAKR
jgi:predicted amidohydrolase